MITNVCRNICIRPSVKVPCYRTTLLLLPRQSVTWTTHRSPNMTDRMFNFNLGGITKYFFSSSRPEPGTEDKFNPANEDRETRPIDILALPELDIEASKEQRARALKHILKVNHINNNILYHNQEFHNHVPHALGSAYLFGGDADHLHAVYEEESKSLEPWNEAPGEISVDDWREYLGKPGYTRAWIDFFEDRLANSFMYDWEKLVRHYLFSTAEDEGYRPKGDAVDKSGPLINNVVAGLAHPLIHLGYGYELSSKQVAIEGLALACSCYEFWHKYLDDPQYTRPPPKDLQGLKTQHDVIDYLSKDERLDGLFQKSAYGNIHKLFQRKPDLIMDYWNTWDLQDKPIRQFESSQRLAVELLVASHDSAKSGGVYSFLLVHCLTSSHAVRTLLPLMPGRFQISLVRQWWLLTLATYIAVLRPQLVLDRITDYDLKSRDWKFVEQCALSEKSVKDAHYVKALRSIRDIAQLWGDDDRFYLKAAVKFADEFADWE